MDVAEKIAAKYADTVYLGVGLHCGYGSAQRMYVKRGYLPDGTASGIRIKYANRMKRAKMMTIWYYIFQRNCKV